jgi:hypothetical protein
MFILIYRLPRNDVAQSQSQLMCTQSSSSSQFTSEEDLLEKTPVLPLSEVIQLDQVLVLSLILICYLALILHYILTHQLPLFYPDFLCCYRGYGGKGELNQIRLVLLCLPQMP